MPATPCPNCGYCAETLMDPVDQLRAWCLQQGHWVGPGDVVSEAVAAEILGRSVNTLRGWRATDQRLEYSRSGAGIRYRLQDLAAYAEKG